MHKFVKHKKIKGKRKHGFMSRMASHGGQLIVLRRRRKKRKTIAI